MCISDRVLKIDINEARKKVSHFKFSAEAFLSCQTAKLIDGIFCIGHHDAEVTDLSVFLRERLHVASASRDGTVRVVTLYSFILFSNTSLYARFALYCS